jgi:hypothetical protein
VSYNANVEYSTIVHGHYYLQASILLRVPYDHFEKLTE